MSRMVAKTSPFWWTICDQLENPFVELPEKKRIETICGMKEKGRLRNDLLQVESTSM